MFFSIRTPTIITLYFRSMHMVVEPSYFVASVISQHLHMMDVTIHVVPPQPSPHEVDNKVFLDIKEIILDFV